jgi:hypothetical protein
MTTTRTHYDTLGLPESASTDEIKAAFRRHAKKLHPDVNLADEAQIKEVNEAYEVLSDENAKKVYDEQLAAKKIKREEREKRHPSPEAAKAFGDHIRGQAGAGTRPRAPDAPPSAPSTSPPPFTPSPPPWQEQEPTPASPLWHAVPPSPQPAAHQQATPVATPSHPAVVRSSTKDPGELIASGLGVLLFWFLFTEGPNGFQMWWNPLAWIPVIGWWIYALSD